MFDNIRSMAYAFYMQGVFTVAHQLPASALAWYLGSTILWCYVAFFVVLQLLDARSRYIEYRIIRDDLRGHPIGSTDWYRKSKKWMDAQKHAPCRRAATGAAIGDIPWSRRYYRDDLGYRWYHLLPDNFFRRAMTLSYWKAAIFKKYR